MRLAILLSLLCAPLFAQPYEIADVTLLKAVSAELVQESDESVLILVKDLDPVPVYGVLILITGLEHEYIEAYDVIEFNGKSLAVLPPRSYIAMDGKPGQYLVTGKPGEKKFIAIRSGTSPVWFEIQIKGRTTPDPDPDPEPDPTGPSEQDLRDIISLVSSSVQSLQDPITQKSIRDELSKVIETLPSDFSLAIAAYRKAIADGLTNADVNPPYKDWAGKFRKPLSDKLETLSISTSGHVLSVVKAVIAGLGQAQAESRPSRITMYTRADCQPCLQWKRDVLPSLKKQGWEYDEFIVGNQVETPQFEVTYQGKKWPSIIVGYMDTRALTNIVNELK